MKHQEGFMEGVRGSRIFYQCWLPPGEARASLIVAHGLAEHSGRYMNLVNRFVPLGYAVCAIDHLGHGKSGGPRLYLERFRDYTDTLRVFTGMVGRWQPDAPMFLIGHSMGGLIAASYLIEDHHPFAGAVLSGPLVKTHDRIPPAFVLVVKVLSSLVPRFRLIGLDAGYISRDKEVVAAYVRDPLVYRGKSTARLAAELARAMARVAGEAGRITLPVFIVHGGSDRLVDPEGSRILHNRAGSVDKTFKVYDGLFHEVFNEPERDRVLGDVESWLELRLNGRGQNRQMSLPVE